MDSGKRLQTWSTLYDTIEVVAAGLGDLNFFQVPQGQLLIAGVPKTNAHTNLIQAGQLPAGYSFKVFACSMYLHAIQPAAATPIPDYPQVKGGALIFRVQQTEMVTWQAQQVTEGGQNILFNGGGAAGGLATVQDNAGNVFNKYHFDQNLTLTLSAQQDFRVTLTNYGVTAQNLRLVFSFLGILDRPAV